MLETEKAGLRDKGGERPSKIKSKRERKAETESKRERESKIK